MSNVKHLTTSLFGASAILPLVVDNIVYAAGVKDNKIVISSVVNGEQLDKLVVLPEDLDLNSIKIAPHAGKKTFVVSYQNTDRVPHIAIIDIEGTWTSNATIPFDFIPAGMSLNFDEPRLSVADGKAVLHCIDYVIDDEGLRLDIVTLNIESDVDNSIVGIMYPVFPGANWTIFALTSDSVIDNRPLLYVLYKNHLTKLPIECVSVNNAIGGLELIKYKPGAKKYVSSFLPGDILDAGITGDRKKLKTVVKKDNTEVAGYIGTVKWMKDTDVQLSSAILTVNGMLLSSAEGHRSVGMPKFNDSVVVIGKDFITQVNPG